jgi:hypothetical protein
MDVLSMDGRGMDMDGPVLVDARFPIAEARLEAASPAAVSAATWAVGSAAAAGVPVVAAVDSIAVADSMVVADTDKTFFKRRLRIPFPQPPFFW